MKIRFTLNGQKVEAEIESNEKLMAALRRMQVWSVKHGCETGECGACSVLIDGRLMPTCVMYAAQADGHVIETAEGMAESHELHPIQRAFVETGAIQCGYCTPAMVLATQDLLRRVPALTETECREALSGVLCRCTGYVKPVQAMLRAAAVLRGEAVAPFESQGIPLLFEPIDGGTASEEQPQVGSSGTRVAVKPKVDLQAPSTGASTAQVVAHPEPKVDAVKLVKGRPVFTDDKDLPGMLHAAMLTSPHAHARIRSIDTSEAKALPGVEAVLTYKDVARVLYASGGQSYPNPLPWDQVSLDSKVRYVGDRVAIVAAESPEIARQALDLIEVDYEVLPAVFDPEVAMKDGAPMIHDEADGIEIEDVEHNIAVRLHSEVGNVEGALKKADRVFQRTYRVH